MESCTWPASIIRRVNRRRFLLTTAGLGAAALWPQAAPPARPTYFVPLKNYRELPADSYAPDLITPREIILHWDGNRNGRELWKAAITYETLAFLNQSVHFAVDDKVVLQMLPMFRRQVQHSYGALGFNDVAINIELAGRNFDVPELAPAPEQVRRTVALTSLLMDYYALPFERVVGHFERDERGLKKDPGEKFMAEFRMKLAEYRASRSPIKQLLISDL